MKRINSILLVLILAGSANAQMSFGPKLALNFSDLTSRDDSYKTNLVPGLTVGGFAHYLLNHKMALQGELLYSREGTKWEFEPTNQKGNIRTSQVRIPILFQYDVDKQFYVEAGPQAKLLLTVYQKIKGEDRFSLKELYKNGSLGAAAGVGYRFTGNKEGLSASLRYFTNFGRVNKTNVNGGNLKIYGFMLGLQYRLWKMK